MSAHLIRFERCAADHDAVAIEQHDFDGNVLALDDMLRGRLRRKRDSIAQRNAIGLRQRKRLRCSICRHDARAKLHGTTRRLRKIRQQRVVDFAALGMQIGQALRQLEMCIRDR